MPIDSVQGAFRPAREQAGIVKRHVSIHTLRHYAEFPNMPSGVAESPVIRLLPFLRLGIVYPVSAQQE
jgi:hypothetical protein